MKFRFVKVSIITTIVLVVMYGINLQILSPLHSQAISPSMVMKNTVVSMSIDIKRIPIGDGHISTTPEVGSVWSCRTPTGDGIGGAHASGNWIHSDGT